LSFLLLVVCLSVILVILLIFVIFYTKRVARQTADKTSRVLNSQKNLLASIAHELRTPLARIRVALDLATADNSTPATSQLSDIYSDLDELELLVKDIMATARFDFRSDQAEYAYPSIKIESVSVQELIDQSIDRFLKSHPKQQLEKSIKNPSQQVELDATLIKRVIFNLLDNARKYSSKENTISILTQSTPYGIQIEIKDLGIGIDAQDIKNVTKPFFRTKQSRSTNIEGFGLGLALSYNIIKAHKGTMEIESQLDQGTTVRLSIPAKQKNS
jgi:signal transduction histidine kinase